MKAEDTRNFGLDWQVALNVILGLCLEIEGGFQGVEVVVSAYLFGLLYISKS